MDSNKPFAERLWDAVDRCGNKCCVGIDPNPALMPGSLIEPPTGRGEAAMAEVLERFCGRILELVRGRVPAVKFQFAFFERWGWRGLRALERSIVAARAGGLLVIGDAKRGDIGSTAEMYARAYLRASPGTPDALTINPYPGRDGVIPFIQVAERHHKGLFILVRTSNPSALEIQGDAGAADSAVARVAAMIRQLDGAGLGARGQGLLGAVAGATYPDDLLALADRLPRSWLLIPGIGAQGGCAQRLDALIRTPRPCLFAASRSITHPAVGGHHGDVSETDYFQAVARALDEFTARYACGTR